jgi:restriction system protein
MPIPNYQALMLPLLRCVSDGQPKSRRDCHGALSKLFQLTPEEIAQLLPSGRQTVLDNRSGWAATHLSKAGMLERPSWGLIQITDRGRQALVDADNGARIDNSYLDQFPEFVAFFRSGKADPPNSGSKTTTPPVQPEPQTPQEAMEQGYQDLRKALADDLLDRIKSGSPQFFERLVLDLLVAMGYGGSREDAAHAVGRSGDDGIDGIIKEDKLGLDSIYLQAKRWEASVGRPVVQGFAGSLEGQRARKGVLITTSKFSQDANDYVRRIEKRIVLINGEQLTNLMIDHGVGVADVVVYSVKRVDEDYFEEA